MGSVIGQTSPTDAVRRGIDKATQVKVVKTICTTVTYANGTVETTTETFIMPAPTASKHTQTATNKAATSTQTATSTIASGTQTVNEKNQPKEGDEASKKQDE